MKRDMDLVRGLLLDIEENQNLHGRWTLDDRSLVGVNGKENLSEIRYHLRLLLDANYIEGFDGIGSAKELRDPRQINSDAQSFLQQLQGASVTVTRMTWEGHEFLDAVRDKDVWEKTKSQLAKVGSIGIEGVKAIAKAYVSSKIEQYTGLDVSL